MAKSKQQRPILELLPPSPWLQSEVQGIQYWVHIPTKQCGIHIRGLARMCGVTHRVIQNAIEKATKGEGEVAQNYNTYLSNLLKGKTIFLEDLAQIGSKFPQTISFRMLPYPEKNEPGIYSGIRQLFYCVSRIRSYNCVIGSDV